MRSRISPKIPPDKISIVDLFDCFNLYSITNQETKLDFIELITELDDCWRNLVIDKVTEDKDIINGDTKSRD